MRIALLGAELEENLGLRYMSSSLEAKGHECLIVAFDGMQDFRPAVQAVLDYQPTLVGLSMVFTSRAREFCRLAQLLREAGFQGHLTAGGHFASLNCERLLRDYPAFDSIGLGEGEDLLVELAADLDDPSAVSGLAFRDPQGTVRLNPSSGSREDLDSLPFPKRSRLNEYFGKPIASILSSRGCWRNCAFCSINAWYRHCGGSKFRYRSVANIVAEMRELYFDHGVRIFNFQDDNFFLPKKRQAVERFAALRDSLAAEGMSGIAIAVKARPDSITREAVRVLDDLGLFRVFLGVENASQRGLDHLNRKCRVGQALEALAILNDFDVHVSFNLLLFEPDTVLEDIAINLRFLERHIENPFNFCRAEAYAGTGLEAKLAREGGLRGDYFGLDYRLKDPRSQAFHEIANHAFFQRNFSDYGLHYFNMQVDFYLQLLRRFQPQRLTAGLRAQARNFIRLTNLDTYYHLCRIYDHVASADLADPVEGQHFAQQLRSEVDERSNELRCVGEAVLEQLEAAHSGLPLPSGPSDSLAAGLRAAGGPRAGGQAERDPSPWSLLDPFGLTGEPIPYEQFRRALDAQKQTEQTARA
jgi:anaerobic magnesium-protoporphyrin IX monomethyl ester cyclase